MQPDEFYVLDYLLYDLRPFGMFDNLTELLPQKINISDVFAAGVEPAHPLSAPPTTEDVNKIQ